MQFNKKMKTLWFKTFKYYVLIITSLSYVFLSKWEETRWLDAKLLDKWWPWYASVGMKTKKALVFSQISFFSILSHFLSSKCYHDKFDKPKLIMVLMKSICSQPFFIFHSSIRFHENQTPFPLSWLHMYGYNCQKRCLTTSDFFSHKLFLFFWRHTS